MNNPAAGPSQRVRVTGPPQRTITPPPLAVEDDSRLGDVYLRSLLRAQLGLALRVLVLLALGIGSLPALFVLTPDLWGTRLAGLPPAWLLLGVLTYPYLYLLGRYYVARAESNEQHYADLVRHREERERGGGR